VCSRSTLATLSGGSIWSSLCERSLHAVLGADLGITTQDSERLWPETEGADHSDTIRQWAELALWFHSGIGPAGAGPLGTTAIVDEDFTAYGGAPQGLWECIRLAAGPTAT